MSRKVTIEFSLVEESKEKTEKEILKDISEAFSKEEITIPWFSKVEKIAIELT